MQMLKKTVQKVEILEKAVSQVYAHKLHEKCATAVVWKIGDYAPRVGFARFYLIFNEMTQYLTERGAKALSSIPYLQIASTLQHEYTQPRKEER